MMPHPERCIRTWQWPYLPAEMKAQYGTAENQYSAPWLKMFMNAKEFCESVPMT
jgi:phosphoribosylformylglycinamidine (FGAM) synthase-like amidotransferase family enzyme